MHSASTEALHGEESSSQSLWQEPSEEAGSASYRAGIGVQLSMISPTDSCYSTALSGKKAAALVMSSAERVKSHLLAVYYARAWRAFSMDSAYSASRYSPAASSAVAHDAEREATMCRHGSR